MVLSRMVSLFMKLCFMGVEQSFAALTSHFFRCALAQRERIDFHRGMDDRHHDPFAETPPPSARQKLVAQVIIAGIVLALLAGGFWVLEAMFTARKADDCLAQGSKRCFQIDTTRLR